MKRLLMLSLVVLIAGALCTGAQATMYPTPAPWTVGSSTLTFGSDLEGSGLFSHSSSLFSIELFDLGDYLAPTFYGSAFGFYFAGTDVTDFSNLITIFDYVDDSVLSGLQVAVVDFNLGMVYDADSGYIQPNPPFSDGGNIGFFLVPAVGSGIPPLFTEPILNPVGLDLSGTFPITSSSSPDDFLITFYLPAVSSPTGELLPLSAHVATGLVPVPEPSGLLFLASGLGLLIYRRRRIK